MAGYLKEPVVLQWDMKTGSYGKIVQHIIEKKVCELDPIKIRYINPKDVDDFSTIDRIKKQILVQCSQIEMDFFEITEEQIEKFDSLKEGDTVYHQKFGAGEVSWIDKKRAHIKVKFGDVNKQFVYPNAFIQGHLSFDKN